MEMRILNNTLSPSFLTDGLLVNTPKGICKNINQKINKILLTSDDEYHTYDLNKFKNEDYIVHIYCLREHENNIKIDVDNFNYYFKVHYIKPYKKLFNILPIIVKREPYSVYSQQVLGLKINKSLILTSFGAFSNQSRKYLNKIDNLITVVKYTKNSDKEDYLTLKQLEKYTDNYNIKNVGLLGTSREIKNRLPKQTLDIGEVIKL